MCIEKSLEMKTICICGGGSLGHVIAGWLSAKSKAKVTILTAKPELWGSSISVATAQDGTLKGSLAKVSDRPEDVLPEADVVLFCYPGFMIVSELERIRDFIGCNAYVGSVFSSTGFFFEALKILPPAQPLWGFQRVPFIARVNEYGKSSHLLGYKPCYHIAVENVSDPDKQAFADLISDWFERPVHLLKNYFEASLTNSNPLLHTSRLYTMFGGDNEGRIYPRMVNFYEEWTIEAAQMLIDMDREFFELLKVLPVTKGYLPPILEYYESTDAESLACKLSSIQGFKGITSPMIQTENGWIPDFKSRYFSEDFPYGLRYIRDLAHEHNISCPNIDIVYNWGISKI
jgi:hypothetical protein